MSVQNFYRKVIGGIVKMEASKDENEENGVS
jgi:hypothetical protein